MTLLGKEKLTFLKKLSQDQDFAAKETLKIEGTKNSFSSVRIIGPFRNYSQVEISQSDAVFLGIDAPLKISGDLPGARIKVTGPIGEIEKDIAIVAKRHLHLSPKEAEELTLTNNANVSVKIGGERALIFDMITVRIKENFSKSVHLDTDEANAAGLKSCGEGDLIINRAID
ncbi:MAG: PduL/EutD family phosphate acyltransferase [Actinobacteria bacterium]|nr:PduL/EutD family phosphate acyltransferase [Actinomycetota bacterium]